MGYLLGYVCIRSFIDFITVMIDPVVKKVQIATDVLISLILLGQKAS